MSRPIALPTPSSRRIFSPSRSALPIAGRPNDRPVETIRRQPLLLDRLGSDDEIRDDPPQEGWSAKNGQIIVGLPARKTDAVVPAPPW